MSRSMKGLKMVMSVRLCEGSMGTLTSETAETPKIRIEDSEGTDGTAAFLQCLKGTYAVEQGYSVTQSKGEAPVVEEFELGLSTSQMRAWTLKEQLVSQSSRSLLHHSKSAA